MSVRLDYLELDFRDELEARYALRPTGWLYNDHDGEPDDFGQYDGTGDLCLACGDFRTDKLHDPCIANLPGVVFACCGHGRSGSRVYVAGSPFGRLEGPEAARKMRELGGHPPHAAFLLDPIRGEER